MTSHKLDVVNFLYKKHDELFEEYKTSINKLSANNAPYYHLLSKEYKYFNINTKEPEERSHYELKTLLYSINDPNISNVLKYMYRAPYKSAQFEADINKAIWNMLYFLSLDNVPIPRRFSVDKEKIIRSLALSESPYEEKVSNTNDDNMKIRNYFIHLIEPLCYRFTHNDEPIANPLADAIVMLVLFILSNSGINILKKRFFFSENNRYRGNVVIGIGLLVLNLLQEAKPIYLNSCAVKLDEKNSGILEVYENNIHTYNTYLANL